LQWRDSRNSERGPCANDTQLDSLKRGVHAEKGQKIECNANRGYCANAMERAHRNSLDAHDKLIQTRPHVRNTIASRRRQFVMRKGKSTITPISRNVILYVR